jgi:hypothetical protein
MSDLRERMITALHNADCACSDTPTHFAAQYTPQADAALAEVATWLRERAAAVDTLAEGSRLLAISRHGGATALERLADEISPTHDEGQTP